jgi:plastocyanin
MYRRIAGLVVLTAVGVGVGAAGVASAAGTRGDGAKATPTKVKVTMDEFFFRLAPKTVRKGTRVTFTVVNKGALGHDFDIAGVKNMPVIGPGKTFKYTVTFKRAGVYRFVCTVPQHVGYGMAGNLPVR